jgi:hypothetical protein
MRSPVRASRGTWERDRRHLGRGIRQRCDRRSVRRHYRAGRSCRSRPGRNPAGRSQLQKRLEMRGLAVSLGLGEELNDALVEGPFHATTQMPKHLDMRVALTEVPHQLHMHALWHSVELDVVAARSVVRSEPGQDAAPSNHRADGPPGRTGRARALPEVRTDQVLAVGECDDAAAPSSLGVHLDPQSRTVDEHAPRSIRQALGHCGRGLDSPRRAVRGCSGPGTPPVGARGRDTSARRRPHRAAGRGWWSRSGCRRRRGLPPPGRGGPAARQGARRASGRVARSRGGWQRGSSAPSAQASAIGVPAWSISTVFSVLRQICVCRA